MKIHDRIYFISFIIVFLFIDTGCTEEMKNIKYYSSFSGYNIPLKPVEEISKDKASSANSFCIGYYDDSGELVRLEKWINNQLFFKHEYEYHINGRISVSRVLNSEGVITVQFFNEKGKLLE